MSRYYLKDSIDLCGWQKLPYAARYYDKNGAPKYQFIDEETFEVLQMCDGTIDFSLSLISDKQRQIATDLVMSGAVRKLGEDEILSRTVPYTYYNNRFIRSLLWSVTGKCNSNCKHCYMAAPEAKYGELDHDTIIRMIDDIASTGIGTVELTGGECLVRKDFLDIVDCLLEHKIYIDRIYTNGFLVDENLLKELNNRNVHCGFSFSFDGVGYHDWLRGIQGAEKITEHAIELCVKDNRLVDVEMCLFKSNLHTLRETINHLASLGVYFIKTCPILDSELWQKNGKGESISFEELYEAYLDYIAHYYEDKKPMDIMLGGFFLAKKNSNNYYIPAYKNYQRLEDACVCGHARDTMYICADGRVSTCMGVCDMDITKSFPFVQEVGVKECLTNSSYMNFIDTRANVIVEHNSRCMECEYKLNCAGGCRAGALNAHPSDRFAIDESSCIIFKKNYISKIQDAVRSVSPESIWDIAEKGEAVK